MAQHHIAAGGGTTPKNKYKMSRQFVFPNKNPYKIPYVKKLFKKYVQGNTLDLFPYPYQQDALITISNYKTESLDAITMDPPYSNSQLKKQYEDKGLAMINANRSYFTKLYVEIKRTMKPGGYLINLGWNSKRTSGFEFQEIILLNHGTLHNDTIITVQRKMNNSILDFMGNKMK